MNDFALWFLTKHPIAALVVCPEIGLPWSLWMRQYGMAAMNAAAVFAFRIALPIASIAVSLKPRK